MSGTDGSLDTTFAATNADGGFVTWSVPTGVYAPAIVVQSSGEIVVVGPVGDAVLQAIFLVALHP